MIVMQVCTLQKCRILYSWKIGRILTVLKYGSGLILIFCHCSAKTPTDHLMCSKFSVVTVVVECLIYFSLNTLIGVVSTGEGFPQARIGDHRCVVMKYGDICRVQSKYTFLDQIQTQLSQIKYKYIAFRDFSTNTNTLPFCIQIRLKLPFF